MTTLLKSGLHPAASDALRRLGITADRIGQTIGDAPASAGTHAADGNAGGAAYCAATDFRIRDLDDSGVKKLIGELAGEGFAAYYRNPGHDHWPDDQARHVHAVYAGCAMKELLRAQVHDWLHGRNGLASHAPYGYWQPTTGQCNIVRALFLAHNQADG